MLNASLLCLVVAITDGDTLTARCGEPQAYEQVTVHLGGIDAPERHQPYGIKARQALSDIALGKTAELHCHKIDHYKRHICSVWIAPASAPDGPRTLDTGLAMTTLGLAWWYRAYAQEQSPQERGQYEFAQQEARAKRTGLWRDPDPVAPWDWRKARRTAQH